MSCSIARFIQRRKNRKTNNTRQAINLPQKSTMKVLREEIRA